MLREIWLKWVSFQERKERCKTKRKMTEKAACQIRSAANRSGKNLDFKACVMRTAVKNRKLYYEGEFLGSYFPAKSWSRYS